MLWIKRNLFLIIGALVAIGLTALAVVYLLSNISKDQDLTTQLEAKTSELQQLTSADPSPDDQNITQANDQLKQVRALSTQMKRLVAASGTVVTNQPPLNNAQFSSLIAVTIADLQSGAENAGVTLTPKYGFTFGSLREKVQFSPLGIPALTTQVAEVREICGILFRSKIHVLDSLRRVPVSADDAVTATDYLDNKGIITNAALNVTITPYEFTFRGFTTELAGVVDGLRHSDTYFVIKGITVETIEVPAPPPPPPPTTPTPGGSKKNAAPAAPKTDLTLILDERPLRIKMSVEVVKPIVRQALAAAPAAAK